ncbi:MAG: glycosyltransferase family 8 protein [Candidatus Onthoplasma sp.]
MNILVSINKGYISHFLTMINSLSKSNITQHFEVYVMHSNLDDEDFKYIESKKPESATLHYIFMDKSMFKGAPKVKRYPYEIYYRIFAPLYLPKEMERILYLDCDLIVHNNIETLYNTDFENNLFVGCTEIGKFLTWFNRMRLTVKKGSVYLNTGVLLMNLTALRNTLNTDKIFKFIKHNGWRMALFDQDVIFKFFGDKVKIVDRYIYNLADRHINSYNRHHKTKIDVKWVEENNVIIHYLGKNKPWKSNYKGILKEFYKKYEIN